MKKVIEHFKNNFSNTMNIQLFVISVILIVCNYSLYKTANIMSNLVRTCSIGLVLLGIVFFGKKSLLYTMFLHAIAIMYFNDYNNYTSFILVIICCIHNRKLLKPYMLIYTLGVLTCCILNKDGFERAIIHIVWCVVFYLEFDKASGLIISLKNHNKELEEEICYLRSLIKESNNLNLTEDETVILSRLSKGCEVKEIDEFSESTVYAKLKNARERNSFLSNEALIEAYKNS